jgi:hypothetical protein
MFEALGIKCMDEKETKELKILGENDYFPIG